MLKEKIVGVIIIIFLLLPFIVHSQNNEYILEFDGNDYVRYSDDSELGKMDGASDYTIEAWIYINTWEDYNRILDRYNCWRIYLGTSNDIRFAVYSGGWSYYYSNDNSINTGEWTHIAIVRDTEPETTIFKIYVNGVDETENGPYTGFALPNYDSRNLYVGNDGSSGNYLEDGYIDEVRLKNVAEDIEDLQTDVHDLPYISDSNTAILFHFDEGSGNYWTDNAAGGNDGRLGGTAEGDDQEPTWRAWDYPDGDLPLPVVLSEFTAHYNADQLAIYWTTQSESNNLGWNVYRGENVDALQNDDVSLLNSQLIPGAGTTSQPSDYSYYDMDEFPENTTLWYWIESVRNSGENDFFGPVSITIPSDGFDPDDFPEFQQVYLVNYPNPFGSSTDISFMLKDHDYTEITVYNAKGQTVKNLFKGEIIPGERKTIHWDGRDDAGNKANSGIYFYKMITGKSSFTKKMILTN
ncbi:MAG: T9SS type A sorting domain-containing protein [Candidatus Cloacimonetes bacterium]|nr:T9SS type A sorting domain-containing protein [Candidatus Cloacimonadota bacterium]